MLRDYLFLKVPKLPLRIGIHFLFCVVLSCNTSCVRAKPDKNNIKIEREFLVCNVREYLKGNIRFMARPIRDGNNYCSLLVGTPSRPYNGDPPLVIRLPNGAEAYLTNTSIDQLKKQGSTRSVGGDRFFDIGSGSLDSGSRWPAGTERIQILPWWQFFVYDDRIMSFRVYYSPKSWFLTDDRPAIGALGAKVLYKFPMSQSEVINVFGRPDMIREYLDE